MALHEKCAAHSLTSFCEPEKDAGNCFAMKLPAAAFAAEAVASAAKAGR
jgi:hypothetical protein